MCIGALYQQGEVSVAESTYPHLVPGLIGPVSLPS